MNYIKGMVFKNSFDDKIYLKSVDPYIVDIMYPDGHEETTVSIIYLNSLKYLYTDCGDSSHVEHNASGCVDLTVDSVIKHEWNCKAIAREDYAYRTMSKNIKGVLESNGYVLEGPISVINLKSGRKRRIY